MGCSKCGRPGVIFQDYSGLDLCPQHFREDLLHKAKKTVRQNHWLVPGTRYAVALSGGLKSCALLDFMRTLVEGRKDVQLMAVTVRNSDQDAMENAKSITEASGIPWFTIPGEDAGIKQLNRPGAINKSPFPAHEQIESQLTLMAEELKFGTLAFGYTLEDHAAWVLWNVISGNMTRKSAYPTETRKRARIIRPFMHIPGRELDLYTRLFLNGYDEKMQAENGTPVDNPIGTLLARFYNRHPGIPYALVNIGEQVKKFRDPIS